MQSYARDHVPALAGLLSVVSLGLVFGAALGYIPPSLLPRAGDGVVTLIPHLNAALSTLAIVTILLGWRDARNGAFRRHRALMLVSLALFAAFLALYLYKVVVAGTTAFPGPAVLEAYVYLPTLVVHVLLAMVCIPLLYYVLLLAVTRPIPAVFETRHASVARVAAALWLISFLLGNVVYAMLYVIPW